MKFGKIDKLIMLGGRQLLADSVLAAIRESFEVLVVTSKRQLTEEVDYKRKRIDFKSWLTKNKIAYFASRDINTDNTIIREITAKTLALSIAAAWIFKKDFIDRFNGRLVNSHGTRLPQNRGGGGFSWQILRRNRLGFAVIHQVDPGIDTGNIIKCKEFIYPDYCRTPRDFEEFYWEKNRALIYEFISEIKTGKELELIKQQEYFSTLWPRLATDIHGFIDWSWPLADIESFICAFDDPYKGASAHINGKRVFLKKACTDFNDGGFHPFQTGIVYRKTSGALFIATKEGALLIKQVSDENGKNMFDQINLGDRFYTPQEYLEKAKSFRAVYTPEGLRSTDAR